MGQQVPPGGGMTQEQIDALLQQVQQNQASGVMPPPAAVMPPPAAPIQPPAVPLPNVAPEAAPQGGFLSSIANMIGNLFTSGTSAAELAGPQAPPITPEELQRRRRLMQGQQAQPQPTPQP